MFKHKKKKLKAVNYSYGIRNVLKDNVGEKKMEKAKARPGLI